MLESRSNEPDISLPLLANHADPQLTEHRPVADEWSHSSSHGKYTKWVAFPFRRAIQALLAVVALVALAFASYGSIVGFHAYQKLVFPHRAVHASPATTKDGSRVVKPYFAPKAKGGVQSGTLLVTIWFREGEEPKPRPVDDENPWEDQWREERLLEAMSSMGEMGYIDNTLLEIEGESTWTNQFMTEIPITDIERTVDKVAHVTLPGAVIHSLVTNRRSMLVATFELLPDPTTIPSSVSYDHRSTRPMSVYGPSQHWPLPYSPPEPISPPSLNAFFAHSSAGRSLKIRERDWRDSGVGYAEGRPLLQEQEGNFANFLSARTWITLASDYSVYGVDQYIQAQDALDNFKAMCANYTSQYYYNPNQEECLRAFDRDGHFENLLISEDGTTSKEWKYGPFLTTRLSPVAPDDYIELPSEADIKGMNPSEVEDFSFDWSVKYFAMSPAKLSLARPTTVASGIWLKMNADGRSAVNLDEEELHRALFGLPVDLGSRPVARRIARFISDGLTYLAIPLILHYWFTRRVSTGISMIPLMILYIADLIYYIVSSAVDMEHVWILIFVLAIICFVAIILKQLYLLSRPDFKLQNHSSGLVYPSAVRFRIATVSEGRSQRLDAQFDWKLCVLLTVTTFCLLRFAPAPPAIVAARKYHDVMQGFGGFQHYDPAVLTVIHILASIRSSFWLMASLSQISLNQRNKSFAGSYAITAYLQFGAMVLAQVTTIFVRWFGRSQVMQPFTVWDVVVLLVLGVMAIQAWMLPKVQQVVEETSD